MEEWQIKHCRLLLRPSLLYSNTAWSKSAVIVDCFCNSFLLYSKLYSYCLTCCVMLYRKLSYRHCYINRILNFRFNCRFTAIDSLNSCEISVISGQSRTEEVGNSNFSPSASPPLPFPPRSIHFPSFLSPLPVIEGGPLNTALGRSGGKLPQRGLGKAPAEIKFGAF